MSTFTVTTDCGRTKDFESRHEAESGKRTHLDLCDECDESDVHVRIAPDPAGGGTPSTGNGDAPDASRATDTSDMSPPAGTPDASPPAGGELPEELPGSVETDPLDVVPGYMITEVEGQPTINKRGYAVIAHHFDIVVQSEAITTAGETDHEYAEFRATAWKKDEGPENGYTGHATARASEGRRGIADNLNEMAETRAMKRAVAWASGVGLLAWEEMAGYLDAD